MRHQITPKSGVVAFRIEASPLLNLRLPPDDEGLKGMTLLSKAP